ncbi:MAG: hypothetical protein K9M10_02245 [Candidatus Pacebacteria bacterium]|nr:hypothetical protein [Candidatus Paceibacterota bacterium]MCF7857281.1 hypothetical protein [Candidatus Paceibacterota bacterium]
MIDVTIALPGDPRYSPTEKEFGTLNSIRFVRASTDKEQWWLLINDGWAETMFPMNEYVRDYIVMMLWRWTSKPYLLEHLSAFNYLEYILGGRSVDAPCINDVADICLQCAAFFPERSNYRHEMKKYHYVVNMGMTLFKQLAFESGKKDDCDSKALRLMSEHFCLAMLVIRSTCPKFLLKEKSYPSALGEGQVMLRTNEANEMKKRIKELGSLYSKPEDFCSHGLMQ